MGELRRLRLKNRAYAKAILMAVLCSIILPLFILLGLRESYYVKIPHSNNKELEKLVY